MIEESYLSILGSRLRNFRRKSSKLYNFSCPFCGDSKKDKLKARGYLVKKNLKWYYYCHNCAHSCGFDWFLKQIAEDLYREYRFEKLKSEKSEKYEIPEKESEQDVMIDNGLIDSLLERVDTLSENHPCRKYVKDRKIPRTFWSKLYFIDDISRLSELKPKYKERIKGTEPRMVIPYWDERQRLVAFNCRSIYPANDFIKYIMIPFIEDVKLVYGIDRLDINKRIYVVEGPIDSLFLPNAIAVGANLASGVAHLPYKDRMVLVPDNQPRNREIVKITKRALDKDYMVSLLPSDIEGKDINDLVKAGYSRVDLKYLIDSNMVHGLSGRVKFSNWRKV